VTQARDYEVHVLNELIVAAIHSIEIPSLEQQEEYRSQAAVAQMDDSLACRLEVAECLTFHVLSLRGKPAARDSILGAAYAVLHGRVPNAGDTKSNDTTATQDGSDYLIERLVAALRDPRISTSTKAIIQRLSLKVDPRFGAYENMRSAS
jgi:hypothetical protein